MRNTQDGLVEVLGEGPRENLDILLAYLSRGPRGAFVTEVRNEWSQATGEYPDFQGHPNRLIVNHKKVQPGCTFL